MTDKPQIILGKGRLYFGDRLLGETRPAEPGDEISLMRPRESTFKATFHIATPNYNRWLRNARVAGIVGYNPQLLLTDQRSPEKKQADAYVEQYRKAFPSLKDFWQDNLGEIYKPKPYQSEIMDALTDPSVERVVVAKGGPRRWADGGTVTGRFSGGREPFPHFLPRSEAILPKDHPMVAVDFGKIEARAIAHYAIPKHIVMTVDTSSFTEAMAKASAATGRLAERMREHARAVSKLSDRMILLALFGDVSVFDAEPERGFAYERRLAKLLKSPDRRQRKRGERLFNRWYRARKGINFTRMYGK